MIRRRRTVAILLTLATVVSACSSAGVSAVGDGRRPVVVATTTIWADIVSGATCNDLVDVDVLVPPGLSAHEFEPSLRDRAILEDADLIVANGLGIEQGFDRTLDASASSGTSLLRIGEAADDLLHSDDGGVDPHVWLDPIRVASTLPALQESLLSIGVPAVPLGSCIDSLAEGLASLDSEAAAILAAVPDARRRLITNHDALAYFADRYRFEVIGSILPSNLPLAQAQTANIATLTETATAEGIDTVFTEPTIASDDAATVARAAGAKLVPLLVESLGSVEGDRPATYFDMIRSNAHRIANALG